MAFDFSNTKPVQLNDDQAKLLEAKLQSQEKKVKRPVASDESVQVWKTPINDRALIYIPNFTRTLADGRVELETERAFIYPVRTSAEFLQIRDTTGLTGLSEQDISGNSPLREIEQENWEIYNSKNDAKAKSLGVDPKSDALKEFRRELINNFSVQPSNEYLYFPIVHIETNKGADGYNSSQIADVKKDKDGKPVLTPYLYRISKSQFDKLFATIVTTLPAGETLGGHIFQFSYITGKATADLHNPARDSGLAFNPVMINQAITPEDQAFFDNVASGLRISHLREVVYELMLLPDAVHAEIAKDAHKRIEDELKIVRINSVAEETPAIETGNTQGVTSAVDGLINNLGGGLTNNLGGGQATQGANQGTVPPNSTPVQGGSIMGGVGFGQ